MEIKKKHVYAMAAAVVAVAAVALYLVVTVVAAPVVANGDNVSVYYTGTFTNGTVFDSNVGGTPINFTVGSGSMIEGFDEGVVGMHVGETKTITVPANEAYGEVNPDLIISFPRSVFGNQTIESGMTVESSSGGEQGTILVVNATNVTVDFNPPLAGQTLVFKITVAGIREG